MTDSVNIIAELFRVAPQLGVLIYFVVYFQKQIGIKDAEIKELNTILRDQQKDAINTMTKLTTVIEDLKELIKEKLQ